MIVNCSRCLGLLLMFVLMLSSIVCFWGFGRVVVRVGWLMLLMVFMIILVVIIVVFVLFVEIRVFVLLLCMSCVVMWIDDLCFLWIGVIGGLFIVMVFLV